MIISILLLTGCAFNRSEIQRQLPSSTPARIQLTDVPFYAQKKYQCGPAALAMTLQWSGLNLTPDDLKDQVYTPGRKGSLQSGLISGARRHERLAYPVQNLTCLIKEIAAGHPVIVLQNLGLRWLPRWHYAVAIGYDALDHQIILHTGKKSARSVGMAVFLRTWRRAGQWGLVVLKPGDMPACTDEVQYLKAALGLEQAGHKAAAISTYVAAVRHWPQSLSAYLGLGNARYTINDLSGAADAFQHAVQIDPQSGVAYNNLAHILAAMGQYDQALAMARRAVALGGPHLDLYQQTLQEILQSRQTSMDTN